MARHERQRAVEVRTRRDSGFQERKAARQRQHMHALTERIARLLDRLKEEQAIVDVRREGKAPFTDGTSTTFLVRSADGQERRFVCTYDFRLARLVSEAPRKTSDGRVSAIMVTHAMRDETVAERILGLFQN